MKKNASSETYRKLGFKQQTELHRVMASFDQPDKVIQLG
jgi:hypothetical protein